MFGGWRAGDRACVVDQNIHRSRTCVELGRECGHGSPISEVDSVNLAPPAMLLYAPDDLAALALEVCADVMDEGRGFSKLRCAQQSLDSQLDRELSMRGILTRKT